MAAPGLRLAFRTFHATLAGTLVATGLLLVTGACTSAPPESAPAPSIRVALFNIRELSTDKIRAVDANGAGADPQLRAAATIIRGIRPDILVINEIDHDYGTGATADLASTVREFAANYLARGDDALRFEYAWAGPSNTGILSGLDLDGDGRAATDADRGTRAHGNDAFGYGEYPGQYSMALLSRYPIDEAGVRSFRELLWRDLPDNHLPKGFYTEAAIEALRLSSKSHQDVPVVVEGHRLHLLLSHPTPPGFDGDEDRNGRRNWDEIRLWVEYLDGADWMVDDQGRTGGYGLDEPFVIAGDLNAFPGDEVVVYDGVAAIEQLLRHPRVQDPGPVSPGAPAEVPAATTAFRGRGARIDYLLPSVGLEVLDGGVHWPAASEDPAGAERVELASDHRLVWIDLRLGSAGSR